MTNAIEELMRAARDAHDWMNKEIPSRYTDDGVMHDLARARPQPAPAAGVVERAYKRIEQHMIDYVEDGDWPDGEVCGIESDLKTIRAAIAAIPAPSVVSEDEAVEIMLRAYLYHKDATIWQPVDRLRLAYRALIAAGVIRRV